MNWKDAQILNKGLLLLLKARYPDVGEAIKAAVHREQVAQESRNHKAKILMSNFNIYTIIIYDSFVYIEIRMIFAKSEPVHMAKADQERHIWSLKVLFNGVTCPIGSVSEVQEEGRLLWGVHVNCLIYHDVNYGPAGLRLASP